MKIIEVRDGFIKFEADENVYLSSFIQISGAEKKYIAQVIQIKDDGIYSVAFAKILFILNENGLSNYDKTVPSDDLEITILPYKKISELKENKTPIVVGYTKLGEDISIDLPALNKKLLINSDDKDELSIILENIEHGLSKAGKRVILIDTSGRLNLMKYTAGEDFKLPLNTASLSFMYEECLNDATDESKALVIDIFKELSEYSKTVPFVPFETLKAIVDDMVDNSHIFKLLVLKNKLSKFARMGYFASAKEEVDKLQTILKSKNAVLDLSKLDSVFQNRYLEFVYDSLKSQNNVQVFIDLSNSVSKKGIKRIFDNEEVSTAFITHSKFKYINEIKNIFDNFIIVPSQESRELFKTYKTFLNAMDKSTYLIAGEAVNYIPLISESVKNIMQQEQTVEVETEETGSSDDIADNEILECVTEGLAEEADEEAPTDVPEVANMFDADEEEDASEESEISDETQEDSELSFEETVDDFEEQEELIQESEPEIDTVIENIEEEPAPDEESGLSFEEIAEPEAEKEETVIDFAESDENVPVQEYEEISPNEEAEEPEIIQDMIPLEEESINDEVTDSTVIEIEDTEDITSISEDDAPIEREVPVIPVSYDESELEVEEIQELNPDEMNENDIVVDMGDDFEEINSDIDDEIARDVDKVYTTRKDYDISDSDLDLIDELNSDEDDNTLLESQEDDSVLEELSETSSEDEIIEVPPIELEEPKEEDKAPEILETRDSSTPIVPVYDADIPQEDMVISDPIQQGDNVVHAKYGNGVVEKMIKYGNKTLFSINFDNVGRRLLDPTLTEIKKS